MLDPLAQDNKDLQIIKYFHTLSGDNEIIILITKLVSPFIITLIVRDELAFTTGDVGH